MLGMSHRYLSVTSTQSILLTICACSTNIAVAQVLRLFLIFIVSGLGLLTDSESPISWQKIVGNERRGDRVRLVFSLVSDQFDDLFIPNPSHVHDR